MNFILADSSGWRELSGHNPPGSRDSLPHCLTAYRGLTRLSLRELSLEDLAGGPYLQDVRSLCLDWNEFAHLPAALSAASRLTHLSLNWNRQLQLSSGDVASLLRLPSLQLQNADQAAHDWQQLAPQLQPPQQTQEPQQQPQAPF
ncbi:leucine-rich repeat-containing isoform A [Chlorella sorokiniana]|uniref:Leucine-rich repeat-containing isoform A n=1 Tax=Chlorella sorokiniana TaxID=3076 RepID=A0A2P6TJX6_CHLSO|nr:leucine-rich repeat-containing isoform A [Chlorella sorokiniana]|eukprot:PRW44373.1 leucine-rich repeat-containing isoform A [Chlorella sorokiniana]